jgi:heme oxygenase
MESLVGTPGSVEAHIQVLCRFFGFLEPWEALVMPRVADLHASLGDRRKVSLLRNDLRNLGLSESAISKLPRCTALPALHDLPRALGSMYVFEGATLGGHWPH